MKRRGWRIIRWIGAGVLILLLALLLVAKLAGFGLAGGGLRSFGSAAAADAERLEGNWAGTWASTENNLTGSLRCRIEKRLEGVYFARFEAVFAKYFTFTSPVELKVTRRGESWAFSGQQDLGVLAGGVYKYDGHCDGMEFVCSYDSKWDKGMFRMKRAAAAPATQPAR